MTAEHEGVGEYGGMDALMAAITGDPLPEEARRDPAFLAEHRAAEADLAVLRQRLGWLAEALTGETEGETEEARPGERSGEAPAGAARPGRPRRVSRRRTLRIALGSLAGAAAFALVAGFGWMVTHSQGAAGSGARATSAGKSAPVPGADDARPADPALELACSRLVVEGTVARVEPDGAPSWSRVTLTVTRSYKPAHGPVEVGFLLDGRARPAPRPGQHVLVTVRAGRQRASLWAVGDARVAAGRAWITGALPGSRHTTCPSAEAP